MIDAVKLRTTRRGRSCLTAKVHSTFRRFGDRFASRQWRQSVPVVGFVGESCPRRPLLEDGVSKSPHSPGPCSNEESIRNAVVWLADTAEQVARLVVHEFRQVPS